MQFHENSKTRRDRLNSLLKCSILRNFDVSFGIAVITGVLSYLRSKKCRTRMKLIFKYLKRNVRRCLEFYLVHFKLYVGEQRDPGEIAQTNMLS